MFAAAPQPGRAREEGDWRGPLAGATPHGGLMGGNDD
jgi:hypothetical protein